MSPSFGVKMTNHDNAEVCSAWQHEQNLLQGQACCHGCHKLISCLIDFASFVLALDHALVHKS